MTPQRSQSRSQPPFRSVLALVCFAQLFDRAFLPNFRGLIVGVDKLTEALRLMGAIASQLAATLMVLVTLAAVVQLMTTRIALHAKIGTAAAAGVAGLQTAIAISGHYESRLSLIAAGAIVVLLGMVTRTLLASRPVRIFGMVAGCATLASLAHGAAIVFVIGGGRAFQSSLNPPQILASLAQLLEALALLAGLIWLRSVRGGTWRAMLAFAVGAGMAAIAWPSTSEAAGRILARQMGRSMVSSLPTLFPPHLELVMAFVAPCLALAALSLRRVLTPAVTGVAGLLLVRSMLEIPMLALVSVISATALLLLAAHPSVMWAEDEPTVVAVRGSDLLLEASTEEPKVGPSAAAAQRLDA